MDGTRSAPRKFAAGKLLRTARKVNSRRQIICSPPVRAQFLFDNKHCGRGVERRWGEGREEREMLAGAADGKTRCERHNWSTFRKFAAGKLLRTARKINSRRQITCSPPVRLGCLGWRKELSRSARESLERREQYRDQTACRLIAGFHRMHRLPTTHLYSTGCG